MTSRLSLVAVLDWSSMRSWILVFLIAGAMASGPASAGLCGDQVDGADVPCACGDIVVSDVVLGDDDPVTGDVCRGDGLILRAAGLQAITVDLAGRALRGDGTGHGIVVIFGGDLGARVISSGGRASITGFDSGVVSAGPDLQLLQGVDIRDAVRDGVRVRGPGVSIRDVSVTDVGRDGFAFSGRGFTATGNRSLGSGRHGFLVMGHGGGLGGGNRAVANAGAGFLLTGGSHWIEDCTATANGKNGIEIVASGLSIERCTVESNIGSGIGGHGGSWRLTDNLADGNGRHGINARGPGMLDGGGNSGRGNGFLMARGGVQCAIGSSPCAEAP